MIKKLGAAVAAIALAFAGSASAAVLFHSGVIDENNRSSGILNPYAQAGLYTFKSDAAITAYSDFVVELFVRYHGHAADGQSWGSGFNQTFWPAGNAPIFAATADGFTMFIDPVPTRSVHSDGCFYGPDLGCNYEEEWQYSDQWYVWLQYEGGSAGKAYEIYFDAMPRSSVVPEPATWAMMIIGIGLVGSGLRSARSRRPGQQRLPLAS